MGRKRQQVEVGVPEVVIPQVLDEVQHSHHSWRVNLELLISCRCQHFDKFFDKFVYSLEPLFLVSKREPAVERLVKFVADFVVSRTEGYEEASEEFLESFMDYLVKLTGSGDKCVRFRATQLLAKILPGLKEGISEEVFESVASMMRSRLRDRCPVVRTFAAKALHRLVVPDEDGDDPSIELYKSSLEAEQIADVRKSLVASLPFFKSTIPSLVERTLDVDPGVRKMVYTVLASRGCIQDFSPLQRATILHNGISDRVETVRSECLKMVRGTWLEKDCGGDVLRFLKLIDVKANEATAGNLLKLFRGGGGKGGVLLADPPAGVGLRSFLNPPGGEEVARNNILLIEAEEAIYWRIVCESLQEEAESLSSRAAGTGGEEAVVLSASAAMKHELLERILPETVAEFVQLIEAHLRSGPENLFSARQLLLLGKLLDFSDSIAYKAAASLVLSLLRLDFCTSGHSSTSSSNNGQSLGGEGKESHRFLGNDPKWLATVEGLAKKVHAAPGEYEKVLVDLIRDLEDECGMNGPIAQWLKILSLVELLLEEKLNLGAQASADDQSLEVIIVKGAQHRDPAVQRSAVICIGLLCHLDPGAAWRHLRLLRDVLLHGHSSVESAVVQTLFDLMLCHGSPMIYSTADGMRGPTYTAAGPVPQPRPPGVSVHWPYHKAANSNTEKGDGNVHDNSQGDNDVASAMENVPLVALLAAFLDKEDVGSSEAGGDGLVEMGGTRGLVAEGFAKLLLANNDAVMEPEAVFATLVRLYFNPVTEDCPMLRQCLFVFFENYTVLDASHQRCVGRAFLRVLHSEWPDTQGGGSRGRKGARKTTEARKHASVIAQFMLQLLQKPLLHNRGEQEEQQQARSSEDALDDDPRSDDIDAPRNGDYTACGSPVQSKAANEPPPDVGHERLALELATEIICCPFKKSAGGKAYIALLGKTIVCLKFRPSQQDQIKCMLHLLPQAVEYIRGESKLVKELKTMIADLKALDQTPEVGLSNEQLQALEEYARRQLQEMESNEEAEEGGGESDVEDGQDERRWSAGSQSNHQEKPTATSTPTVRSVRPQRKCKVQTIRRMTRHASAVYGSLSSSDSDREEEAEADNNNDNSTSSPGSATEDVSTITGTHVLAGGRGGDEAGSTKNQSFGNGKRGKGRESRPKKRAAGAKV